VVPTAHEQARRPGLPAEVSSLVGRGPQVTAVLDRLRTARVVTLAGPGGCGKTRVALRVATLAEGGFRDGARLVELASLADPALVPAYVAQALEIPERGSRGPTEGLVRSLAERDMLIVLDNCEHVQAQAAGLVAALTGRCPRVRVVTTSRERLDVPGEFVFPVPPLGLPEDGSVHAVAASEAGRLFTERARAADPAFELTDSNAAAIAEVCARLDGMPLAIELASARCPALGPAQLAARLHQHPGLLSGGPGRPDRHRSLEALVAWSYDLLDEAERRLLARLSVLRGGFDLELAEQVAGSEPLAPAQVAGLLASLAGKSVVQIQVSPAVRYSLLETIRQFAAGRLASSGEEAAAHARLLGWALELARAAEATVASAGWPAWSGRLATELANLRAALSWALGGQELGGQNPEAGQDPEAGRELAARLARWWIATGRFSEAGQFLATALAVHTPAAPPVRARLLLGAAWSVYDLGDGRQAAALAGEGVACAQQAQQVHLEFWGRNLLAALAWTDGDADRIRDLLADSVGPLAEADPALASRAEVLLANAAVLAGDLAEQERHGRRAIELARAAPGREGLALALTASTVGAITGTGIGAATQAALDEAAEMIAKQPDLFTEVIMRHWRARLLASRGQAGAAETEVARCWAAGQAGAVRLAEFLGPLAEARLATALGDAPAAAAALRRAADGGQRVAITMLVPTALAGLACVTAVAGDASAATAAVAETRALLGGRRQAITLATLGYAEAILAWHRGELADAEHLARAAVLEWHQCRDLMDACDGLELLGVLAAARERPADAARLLAAAAQARPGLGYLTPGFAADRRAAAQAADDVRRALGEEEFAQARAQGRALTVDEAVALATRRGGGRKRPTAGWASLTPAELEVIRLVGQGLRNDAIARKLFIAPGTVKVHLSHIFTKLGVTTRAELAAQASVRAQQSLG
jgi:predicted ATPase/DNA-binding CsgD family transcriptional regulator